MCSTNLQSLISTVVADFVRDGLLFTALDVSNKVKETMPMARHREVRDAVRNAWLTDIEPNSYGRSPINVNLADGTTAEALLYHPLVDSWDLDTKYDVQQRAKTTAHAATAAPVAVTVGATTVSVSNSGAIINTPLSVVVASPKVVTPAPVPVATPNVKDLWSNMFQSQPSLFPRQ